jgi:hypothetical protein
VRALLGSGADPTIAANDGITPVAIANQITPLLDGITVESRREYVSASEVGSLCPSQCFSTCSSRRRAEA